MHLMHRTVRVFVENEAGSLEKNLFNEKTLEYWKTVQVSAAYPFPYGFLVDTTSGDGDNLDCFVLTERPLKSRTFIEVEPIGMFEQIENGKADHKILARIPGENPVITAAIEATLRNFIANVFSHRPGKEISVGAFLGIEEAWKLIDSSRDIAA